MLSNLSTQNLLSSLSSQRRFPICFLFLKVLKIYALHLSLVYFENFCGVREVTCEALSLFFCELPIAPAQCGDGHLSFHDWTAISPLSTISCVHAGVGSLLHVTDLCVCPPLTPRCLDDHNCGAGLGSRQSATSHFLLSQDCFSSARSCAFPY